MANRPPGHGSGGRKRPPGRGVPATPPKLPGHGKGTKHRPAAQPAKKGCPLSLVVAIPAVLFYAAPRMLFDNWRERRAKSRVLHQSGTQAALRGLGSSVALGTS